MITVLLVIHLMLTIALVVVVLLQRSEGGALGMGGGGGGMGGFMTGRSAANLLTRVTGMLAGAFMLTSLTLSLMANSGDERRSLIEDLPTTTAPTAVPEQPKGPAAPLDK